MNAKPLFVLLFFGFLISIFAGGAIGDTDLTPDTPPASAGGAAPALFQDTMAGSSSLCASLYAVQSGDTLSGIARSCALTLADLLAANPQITNANLIHVGDRIVIPGSSAPAVVNNLPVEEPPAAEVVKAVDDSLESAAPTKAPLPTETAVPVEAAASAPAEGDPAPNSDAILSAFETARAPEEGAQPAPRVATPSPTQASSLLLPGSLVEVSVAGFPPNAPVTVGIGQVGKVPFTIDESITNDEGVVTVIVAVPANARRNQKWTVTITTKTADPSIVATAVPFVIGK
jgi:LysM repeat protein